MCDLEHHAVLDAFPIRGACVIGYFVEQGDISGYLYVGIVEQCGRRQYRLRWNDWSTETFQTLNGKTKRYQRFRILGYVALEDYQRLCSTVIRNLHDAPHFDCEPCKKGLAAFTRQRSRILELQKQYESQRAAIPTELTTGQPISFAYSPCLETPQVVTGFYSRIFDGYLYANCDARLKATRDEDSFIYIPRNLLLSVGG